MRRVVAVALGLVLYAGAARADEWSPAKPKAAPTGNAIALRRSLSDAARLPRARVITKQTHAWKDRKQAIALEADATTKPAPADGMGRPQIEVAVEVTGLAVDQEDFMPGLRAKGATETVLSAFDAHGYAAQGTPKGTLASGKVGEALRPVGAWLLPYLPEKPVRVGETWDLPLPYFLWCVNQLGAVPAEGFATQVLDAVEDRGGVRCARVRTVAAIRRPQPAGMTPSEVGIGEGAALARLHAEGTCWIDLDGGLREESFDLSMRVENTASKAWMEWTFHREVKAQPMGAAPKSVDWRAHMGKLDFVVGYEEGMDKAWEAGRPAMLFFTSAKDHWCPLFAARTWKDKEVLDAVKAYLPVLVDADASPDLVKRYEVLLLPAIAWVDSEGNRIFLVSGDSPLDLFRTVVQTPRDRAPEVGPSESLLASRKAADALHAALKAGDLKGTLRAVHDALEVNRPKALVVEAKAAQAEIDRKATEDLAAAKALVEAGKKDEAKAALQRLKQVYGDHPVGREAWALLRRLTDEEK